MSADNYPNIFSHQMEAIVYLFCILSRYIDTICVCIFLLHVIFKLALFYYSDVKVNMITVYSGSFCWLNKCKCNRVNIKSWEGSYVFMIAEWTCSHKCDMLARYNINTSTEGKKLIFFLMLLYLKIFLITQAKSSWTRAKSLLWWDLLVREGCSHVCYS